MTCRNNSGLRGIAPVWTREPTMTMFMVGTEPACNAKAAASKARKIGIFDLSQGHGKGGHRAGIGN